MQITPKHNGVGKRPLAGAVKGGYVEKVIITADTVLSIIQTVFNDNDIDQIQSSDLPEEWQGKSIQEILNIKYYTFKHRPESTEMIIAEKKQAGVDYNELEALNRAFGCLVLSNVDRIFAKNTDVATCSATLDFWVQTSKIKLLEYLIDKVNIALSGRVLPIDFQMGTGNETHIEHRTVAMVFGNLTSPEFEPDSPIGESVKCSVDVQLTIQPETILMSNIKFEFATTQPVSQNIDNAWDSVMTEVVVEDFNLVITPQPKSIPLMLNNSQTGMVNLSKGRNFALTIPVIKGNTFVQWLKNYAWGVVDVNSPVYLRATDDGIVNIYKTVVSGLTYAIKNDGTDAMFSLTLSEAGL